MAISQIVQNSLANTISLGPKITSVQVANSSYTVLDDTSINIGGGYIVITGSGFQSNCSVIVDSNLACSVAFVSATQVRAQLPAKAAGTYNIYLLNGDGGTAIRVNALQYSNTPTWVTTSPLTSQNEDSNVSIQLSATGANTYVLQTGSTLPTGLTLSANGLISGTVNTNVSVATTYNFTVEAIDTENQETPKAFAITITVGDPDFYRTTLLLDGNGTNGANNNVFRDSSSNNFTVTRNANTAQGSFSSYSPAGWSNYLNATRITYTSSGVVPEPLSGWNSGTGTATIEAWIYPTALDSTGGMEHTMSTIVGIGDTYFAFGVRSDSKLRLYWWTGSQNYIDSTSTIPGLNQWIHIAITRNNSNLEFFINGVSAGTSSGYTGMSSWGTGSNGEVLQIGQNNGSGASADFYGYISNLRFSNNVRSVSLPTADYTSDANTLMLTCNRNRLVDIGPNNYSLVASTVGETAIPVVFSPFNPTATYSTGVYGGSIYFDGTDDYLELPVQPNWRFGSRDFTIETWMWLENSDLTNTLAFHWNGTTTGTVTGSTNVPSYQWVHVAVTRTGTTMRFWINGVEDSGGSKTVSSIIYNNDDVLRIGRGADHTSGSGRDICHCGEVGGGSNKWFFYLANGGTGSFKGYMTDFRISKSVRYTGTFTPQTTPLASDSNTELLLNASNAAIYNWKSSDVIETVGAVQVNTSISKWGTGSISFGGSVNNFLYSNSSHSFKFGTGDFTIEGWYYFNSLSTYPCLFDSRSSNPGSDGCAAFVNSSGQIELYSGQSFASGGSPVSTGVWTHIAFVRQSGNLKVYVNGSQVGSTTSFGSNMTNSYYFIGRYLDLASSSYPVNGNIDDFRVSKFARYTGNFTAPTSAFLTR